VNSLLYEYNWAGLVHLKRGIVGLKIINKLLYCGTKYKKPQLMPGLFYKTNLIKN